MELLVAVAVFGVMAALAYGGIRGVMNARLETSAAADRLGDLQLAVSLAVRDLQQGAPRPVRGAYGDEAPALAGGEVGVELTRAGHANPTGARRSTLERVRWGLESGSLVRWSWPVLDRTPATLPAERRLLDGVEALRFRYHFRGQWYESWPPRRLGELSADRLPEAVELTVELRDWGRVSRVAILPEAR